MADLTNQIAKLLPNGEAWPKSLASNLYQTIALFTNAYQRAFDFGDYAQRDTFPITAQDSVDVWQASVSLPDLACPPLNASQQKQQMVARVENLGGQSVQYYIDFALKIGYTITITELACPRSGISKVQVSQSNGVGADHIWCINATLSPFRAGQNRAGDLLSLSTSIAWLQYEFNRIKPSQTIIEWFAA